MYLEHFGLSAPPFQFTASPTALFMSRTHREGLAALEWGLLHEPSGLTMLAGETGVGKTTLACAVLAQQHRQVRAAYLGSPRLSFEELLGSVLGQLGVRGGRANKSAMINALVNFARTTPAEERIAILIDEAQGLSDDALEDFRLLSNLERGGRKAVQLILVGQLELARRLAAPEMRHLNERIGARTILVPLTRLESGQYIEHRLRLCGSSPDRIFARTALDLIVRHSGGVPRRINAISHNALLVAYSQGAARVSAAMVKNAVQDYDGMDGLQRRSQAVGRADRSGGRSLLRPMLAMGLLGITGFVTGRAVLGRHPICHLRSLAEKTAAVAENTADKPRLDSGIVIGTPAADAATAPAADAATAPAATDAMTAPAATDAVTALAAADAATAPTANVPPRPIAMAAVARPEVLPGATSIVGTDPAAAASAPKPAPRSVIIARGDTLSAIALHYLGSTAAVDSLLRLNPQIVDARHLYPGQRIYLPDASHTNEAD